MTLNVLFIGDMHGRTGRNTVKHFIPKLKKELNLDLIIANGENATHGRGLSKKHYEELKKVGIDVFTMGNHYLDDKDILNWVDKADVVRPANISDVSNGKKSIVVETNKGDVRISNVIGRMFIKKFKKGNPFDVMEDIISKTSEKIHIVDFHGEATSEKKCFAYYFSNKLSAVIGTHTHIQTADERILNNHTGYISDAGFCGAYESVLGVNTKGAIKLMKDSVFDDISPAKSNLVEFNAVYMEFDLKSGSCKKIKRINEIKSLA